MCTCVLVVPTVTTLLLPGVLLISSLRAVYDTYKYICIYISVSRVRENLKTAFESIFKYIDLNVNYIFRFISTLNANFASFHFVFRPEYETRFQN